MLARRSERLARFIDRVTLLDEAVDKWAAGVRGPRLDPVFYGLSSAADHGLLWLALGAMRATRSGNPESALRLGVVMGVESALTNGPIKQCFRRVRPVLEEIDEELPYGMHHPITSSFPSGHAASAFTAATVLAGGPITPALYALATLVAVSRVYVRMHHASDIIAGAALGIAIGAVARKVFPLDG
ncbi:MAG: phosphatase PAP2 family protein [Acidimicrobiia bacterium]